ncbi:MAG: AtpZ/AtpI family protein [Thermonemataceae bacterium]|nr:AtpZ/AtpI family protein [Thermonemataceae bacterium]
MFFKKINKTNQEVNSYAKYSGIAFQMIVSIGLAVWGGLYLDEKIQLQQPYFTIGLTLMTVVAVMISVIKNFLPKK